MNMSMYLTMYMHMYKIMYTYGIFACSFEGLCVCSFVRIHMLQSRILIGAIASQILAGTKATGPRHTLPVELQRLNIEHVCCASGWQQLGINKDFMRKTPKEGPPQSTLDSK